MSLLNYWPTLEQIHKCIKSEAESVSDEVLLAVHQQFPIAYTKVGPDGKVMPDSKSLATEEELLHYLLGSAPEGSLVVPITGLSGVGKSHLIRILDARLRRLPESNQYLIIRIPKSASLRRVVELILEAPPLQDPKYDTVKAEFDKALADIPLDQAVILFQAQLKIALNEYTSVLTQKLRQNPTDQDLKQRLHTARNLPSLLSDSTTEEYFHTEVLPRIIQRVVEGGNATIKDIDSTDNQFKAEDFNFPSSVNISAASVSVRNFNQLTLVTQEGRGKKIAADVLNAVVDQATQQLYQLNHSLGGKTLAEVIGDIRRLLFIEDNQRELIILVEDFAALVGIQGTLAKILIQHGETDGVKTQATIRSAIAVTDGYLDEGRDTLATRAGREWVVESRLKSEEETLRRTKLLVASYINAARHGESTLKQYYEDVFANKGVDKERWVAPIYSDGDEEDEIFLHAFGYEGEIPLFPFTNYAIECLARSALTLGNTLVFNPRYIIKNVIREVLKPGRKAFIDSHFPPPELRVKSPSSDVAQWLTSLSVSDEQRKRYERLVTIWGNNPQSRSDIGRISAAVFEVFGLQNHGIEFVNPPPEPLQIIGTTKDKRRAEGESHQNEQQLQEYKDALESWVQNDSKLKQAFANKIRSKISMLLNKHIDWNAERCLKREIQPNHISIPHAGGEGNIAKDAIMIAPNNDDPEGSLRGELMALLRYYDVYGPGSDYEGMDEDLARIANLADRLLPEILKIVRATLLNDSFSAIHALAVTSRLLGIQDRGCTPGSLSSFLFGDIEEPEVLPDTVPQPLKDWRALQNIANTIKTKIREKVLETNGCFQGTGKTAYGVDIIRILNTFPKDNKKFESADMVMFPPELRQSMQSMADVRVFARFKQLLRETKKIENTITDALGEDFDKYLVADTFKELGETLKSMGAWNTHEIEISANGFVDLCEAFKNISLKESLSSLKGLCEEIDEDQIYAKQIVRGARLPLQPLIVAEHFLTYAKKVMKAAESRAQTMESQYQGVNPEEKAKEISRTFEHIVADLETLQSGDA
ncbi:hypothetical protein C4565_05055 [Candidatus Parcubacteria bacterium]|nr:MAG: hypothetical protein C4565_05055 [Candidatus Parcubacteria bacterium]